MTSKCIGKGKIEFVDKYFPPPPPSDPSSTRSKPSLTANPFEELKDANTMSEKKLQDTFIDIVNQHGLAPGLKMGSCETRPDSAEVDPDRQKVDAAFWRSDVAPSDNEPHWIDQLMPVEFKAWKSGSNYQDPYRGDPKVPGGVAVRDTALPKKNFGQIISYAELVFIVQQRVAVFMPIVIGRVCRFLRWDHGGAVVTEAIDYYEDWEFFCDVLWRISQCSDEVLGIDPSAVRLSDDDDDFTIMDRAAIPNPNDIMETERKLDVVPQAPFTFKYVRDMFRKSLDAHWPRYRLEVPDGEATRHFLVCKPVFHAKGLIGRGTRGYVALDCDTGRFVWLKDAWRAYYLLLEKEGDILAKLKDANVPLIPTLVCHGDIRDQTTLTSQEWELKNPDPKASCSTSGIGVASSSGSKRKRTDDDDSADIPPPKGLSGADLPFREDCPLRIHRHYRLVEEEVAMRLSEFQTGEQLAFIIFECIFAHFKAATNTVHPILHRDVSGGNILIYPRIVYNAKTREHCIKWSGLLADWEMSKPFGDKSASKVQRQPERTGTWQFMSVALLSRIKSIEICDELEAFFYVLLYYAARYLQSNVDNITLANYLDAFFDQYTETSAGYHCGTTKRDAIQSGKLVIREGLELQFGGPMDDIIAALLSWFKSHHVVSAYNQSLEEERKRQEAQAQASSLSPGDEQTDELKFVPMLADEMDLPGQGSPEILVARKLGEPSFHDWKDWQNVKSHRPVVQLFQYHLMKTWPKQKNIGDRIPKSWVKPALGSTAVTATSSNKRARHERVDGVATLPIPVIKRNPPTSPSNRMGSLSDRFWREQRKRENGESLPLP
ncbi:hypothetical protein L226DRAFT_488319 [Lentinus tigrinus ALCF2SS1-7]|uniref:Fungal-type protein kinase domain-containing protein n=1 Tax=Lentinus tigrinus ALCF2SS1-6 TaxID=1328759 RepID=A0A5C2RSW9_9APHY|nr:hypothetical protein L227DRAFT_396314 [Lentinus tigrinus ALCF2SS1-6]RPD73672.1 hypothetical protein L226DRAFT_488319 [Lentinus tigrinus ALCF2SS1-7]